MIRTWLTHKILEHCIDICFREFFKNFIFPQIMPNLFLTLGKKSIIISDNGGNELTLNLQYETADEDLYSELVAAGTLQFLKKYHTTTYNMIIQAALQDEISDKNLIENSPV